MKNFLEKCFVHHNNFGDAVFTWNLSIHPLRPFSSISLYSVAIELFVILFIIVILLKIPNFD